MTDAQGQTEFRVAETKSYVKILYRVQVVDGPVLKGAEQPEEMDFVTGYGHVIPGLEQRLIGRVRGEKLSFTVPVEEAFGQRRDDLVVEKSKEDFHFPKGMEPYPGMELPLIANDSGAPDTVMIREVREHAILIDFNHPLSGLPLKYDLEIVEARPATETDVCGEWDEKGSSESCGGCSPHEIVLGNPSEGDPQAN